MLWLAGLMGLMAAGAALYVDVPDDTDTDREPLPEASDPSDVMSDNAAADMLSDGDAEGQSGGYAGDDVLEGVIYNAAPGVIYSDTEDFLDGGNGDDPIIAGQDNSVHNGDGADQIVLGDWISAGHNAEITGFSVAEDSLLFIWDDTAPNSAEPRVTLMPDPDNAGQFQVVMEDQIIAQVSGDEDLGDTDFALIALSDAGTIGLIPAEA
jgi:hypothetical protein